MILYIVILFISVIISALSQVLLKKSAIKQHGNIIFEYLNANVICGYLIFFTAICLDLTALKKVPISFLPIVESSSYIFVLIFSRIFFKERISARKITGILIMITGIFIFLL